MNTKFALIPRLIILTVLTIALAIGHPANADFIDQEVESAVIGASSRNLIAQQSSRHPSLRLNFANPGAPEAGSVLSINDVTLLEGDSGTANAVFTVTLTPADLVDTVTVDYTTANSTATQPADYTLTSGTLTFNPGETSQPISVPVVGDTLDEIDETYFVNLSNPINATISDNQGVGTITDDDLPPTLSINDVALLEGNSGTTNATFTVSLSAASSKTITVSYATADNSAFQPGDYISTSGTLTFNPGVTSQPISVPVVGDLLDEVNETYFVNLSNPINATILDSQGLGTITDDDDPPTLSINDVAVPEGNSGSTNATFTVTLSAVSSKTITVNYATADNSAIQPGDYTSTSGTLTFNPGVTSQPISVPVLGDTLAEANETFFVNLSTPTNATILDPQGQGTIADDDAAPTLSINDVIVLEGNSGTTNATFTVTLSAASGQTITVNYATANNSAIQPGDYTLTSGTLTFNPGNISLPIPVPVVGDTLAEANETFFVNLSTPTNATILDPQGLGTITDDDAAPTLSIDDVVVLEGNSGTTNATFTVSLSTASGQTINVSYATADNTAVQPGDYTPTSGTLTFNPGNTSLPIAVPVLGDNLDEIDETFFVNLSNPVNATILDPQGLGTITDDDGSPTLSINDVSVLEGNSGTTNATFIVSLSAVSGQTITVSYATADDTAVQPGDYTLTSGSLTFNPGDTSLPIPVPVVGDARIEVDETFFVNLSAPTNATILDPQGLGTITNDDLAGATVDPNTLLTAELGDPVTFTVMLNTQPSQLVTIGISSADTTEGTVSPPSLDFTSTNWNIPQTVTVTPVDDHRPDGPIVYNILTAPAVSNDLNYAGFDAPDVSVTNADNDTPGITIAPLTGLNTSEGEEADDIQIVLNTVPDFDVTITLSSSDPGEGKLINPLDPNGPRVNVITITFTPLNWDTVQKLFLIGVDDLVIDGDVTYSVIVTSASDDLAYDGFSKELAAINENAPSIEWVLPVGDGGTYETDSLVPILLKVRSISPEPISFVRFVRYDKVNSDWVTIGEDSDPPYQLYLNPADLHFEYNQINAYAFDLARDSFSIQKYIFIFRRGAVFRFYLPLILNQP